MILQPAFERALNLDLPTSPFLQEFPLFQGDPNITAGKHPIQLWGVFNISHTHNISHSIINISVLVHVQAGRRFQATPESLFSLEAP